MQEIPLTAAAKFRFSVTLLHNNAKLRHAANGIPLKDVKQSQFSAIMVHSKALIT